MPKSSSALTFNPKTHVYRDGKTLLPSVTSVIGQIEDKGGLIKWAAKMTAKRALDEVIELSRRLRLDGYDAALEWLIKASEDYRDAAGVSGSDLHDVADRISRGEPKPAHLDRDTEAMLANVDQFYADFAVTTIASEVRVANRDLGYAGTTDGLLHIPSYGELPVVSDWKTSASGYRRPEYSHGKHAMQLAPYSRAEVMFHLEDRTEEPMPPVNQDTGLIIFIRPEGYKVYEFDLEPAWPQFKRAVENYRWWRASKKLGRLVTPAAA